MFGFARFNKKHYYLVGAVGTGLIVGLLFISNGSKPSSAVGLGTADNFAILAGETITSTGATTVNGQIGLHPGTSITQDPPIVLNGSIHLTDDAALAAKNALVIAYNEAAAAITTGEISADLGGRTLVAGVYTSAVDSSLGLTGTLTLDAEGDPNATWIFQAGSTLTTASSSSVVIINGGSICNVFWQVGSSATLGSSSTMVGTVMALTSISANAGAVVEGRLFARNGEVTLISNTISRPVCAAATSTPAPTDTATPSPTESGGVTSLETSTPAPTATSTPAPTATSTPAPVTAATATPQPSSTPTATSTPAPTPSPQVSDKPTGSVATGG